MADKVPIYGGSGGIGSATGRALLARGYELQLVARGEPRDVASLAAFLVGLESGWITGQVFRVDGGRSRVRAKG